MRALPHEPRVWAFLKAPRCGARNRRGRPCRCPVMRGRRRCRLHGGKSTGPRSAEGIERIRQAATKHGFYSKELKRERQQTRLAIRLFREYLARLPRSS